MYASDVYHENFSYHGSSYSWYEYMSWYDITYLHANHNEETGKQVIIMNHTWLVCILASCLMFEGSFDNFYSSKTLKT